jgi:NADH:ubiquinone oxidoreductase subunit F (NADH-binding)
MTMPFEPRLLAGPPPASGPERLEAHRARLGTLPPRTDRRDVISVVEASGLLGRGGAGFPVGRKWRAVAEHAAGDAVVVVNGAEGEPRSAKDRVLMEHRPHLVLDGAAVAADVRVQLVAAPVGYIAGEATAVVHYLNAGDARPTFLDARPHERGVAGRPTLVQNVESLAQTALIARFGDAWYREAGRGTTRGSALVTVSGASGRPTVREIEYGTPVGEVARLSAAAASASAVLLGGYFGAWAAFDDVRDEPLDPVTMRERGLGFGCGVVSFSGPDTCGVAATAEIMTYMAGATAAQCGPCVYGLADIAQAVRRLADGTARDGDIDRIGGWAAQVDGRGACHHPDGAIALLRSALRVFADDFARHQARRRCLAGRAAVA